MKTSVFLFIIGILAPGLCGGCDDGKPATDAGVDAPEPDAQDAFDAGADQQDDGDQACILDPDLFPTYAANAAVWNTEDYLLGFPTAELTTSLDGLTVTAGGRGTSSLGLTIAGCSYLFGDSSGPVEVVPDAEGNCEGRQHTYTQPGGYSLVFTVWTEQGAFAQTTELIPASVTSIPDSLTDFQQAFIGPADCRMWNRCQLDDSCLEAIYWIPQVGEPPYPVMLTYTPYPIQPSQPDQEVVNGLLEMERSFLASGLSVVRVTSRGQFWSCGPTDMFGPTSQADLLRIDTWIGEQDWATGDYCLYGFSGPGVMSILGAANDPPHLKCAFIGGQSTELWQTSVTKSGAWWPFVTVWTMNVYGLPALWPGLQEMRIPAVIDTLVEFHKVTLSDYFDQRDRTEAIRDLGIPVFFVTSWDDVPFGGGPMGGPYFDLVQDMPHSGSAMLVLPGPHRSFDPSNQRPLFTFPSKQAVCLREMREFLLSHLLGDGHGATDDFNYLYFRQRGGVQAAMMNHLYGDWGLANSWPPEGTAPVDLYLAPVPSATIASRFDGSLELQSPVDQDLDPFAYQPAWVWDTVIGESPNPYPFYSFPDLRGQERAGLTFTSLPLESQAMVEGPLTLTLAATTDLYDFDWMVLLSDVWPDGSAHRIGAGHLRASLRHDVRTFEPSPQGAQTYRIELTSLANVFSPGHRIRLSLHQVNTTDQTPDLRTTTLHLGAERSKLGLNVVGGALDFAAVPECIPYDPEAVAAEPLEPYRRWFLTAGVRAIDPQNFNAALGIGFWIMYDAEGNGGGALLYDLLPIAVGLLFIDGVSPSSDPDWDFDVSMVAGENHFRMSVRCGRQGSPGTLTVQGQDLAIGPIQVESGMIRCYDVPLVNFTVP